MSRARTILTPLLIIGIVVGFVARSWSSREPVLSAPAGQELSLEERLLFMQAKLFIGAESYLPRLLEQSGDQGAKLEEQLRSTLSQVSTQILEVPKRIGRERLTARGRAILAARLGQREKMEELFSALQRADTSDEDRELDTALQRVLREQLAGGPGTTQEREELLFSERLLEFRKLLYLEKVDGRYLLPEAVRKECEALWLRFFFGVTVLSLIVTIAALSFLTLNILWFSGKLRAHFAPPRFQGHLLGETFFLYLAMMVLSPWILRKSMDLGLISDPLIGNVLLILGTSLCLLWPLLFRTSLRDFTHAIGLRFGGIRKIFTDIALAPFYYLASWVALAAILIVYSMLLTRLDIDINQGAHPIVPVLLAAEDGRTPILIALLATLIAPLVEEVMFRGVLYGYLRSLLSPAPAIFLSAFCFAVIHPQGPIGVIPLTAIGVMLGIAREWRGSLITPILTHACVNGGTLLMLRLLFV